MNAIQSFPTLLMAFTLPGTQFEVAGQSTSVSTSHHYSRTYLAPDFEDRGRTEQIRNAISNANKIFEVCAEENHLPGLVYGVVVDQMLVLSGGVGTLNVSANQPASGKSLFRIASMTKSFTAMAVLKLRDEGFLSLQDPVSDYIPELANLVYPTEDSNPLTIHNLLTMTSGLPEDNPWGDRYLNMTDQEFTRLLQQGLSFSSVPSQQYEYSNLG